MFIAYQAYLDFFLASRTKTLMVRLREYENTDYYTYHRSKTIKFCSMLNLAKTSRAKVLNNKASGFQAELNRKCLNLVWNKTGTQS